MSKRWDVTDIKEFRIKFLLNDCSTRGIHFVTIVKFISSMIEFVELLHRFCHSISEKETRFYSLSSSFSKYTNREWHYSQKTYHFSHFIQDISCYLNKH